MPLKLGSDDKNNEPTLRELSPTELSKLNDDAFRKIRAALVDGMGLDEDEVQYSSRLKADLSVDSIDFLDTVFRMERQFGVKIPRSEIFPEEMFIGDCGLIESGRVTPKGIEVLREKLKHAHLPDVEKLAKDPRVENIENLFTVQMLVNFMVTHMRKALA